MRSASQVPTRSLGRAGGQAAALQHAKDDKKGTPANRLKMLFRSGPSSAPSSPSMSDKRKGRRDRIERQRANVTLICANEVLFNEYKGRETELVGEVCDQRPFRFLALPFRPVGKGSSNVGDDMNVAHILKRSQGFAAWEENMYDTLTSKTDCPIKRPLNISSTVSGPQDVERLAMERLMKAQAERQSRSLVGKLKLKRQSKMIRKVPQEVLTTVSDMTDLREQIFYLRSHDLLSNAFSAFCREAHAKEPIMAFMSDPNLTSEDYPMLSGLVATFLARMGSPGLETSRLSDSAAASPRWRRRHSRKTSVASDANDASSTDEDVQAAAEAAKAAEEAAPPEKIVYEMPVFPPEADPRKVDPRVMVNNAMRWSLRFLAAMPKRGGPLPPGSKEHLYFAGQMGKAIAEARSVARAWDMNEVDALMRSAGADVLKAGKWWLGEACKGLFRDREFARIQVKAKVARTYGMCFEALAAKYMDLRERIRLAMGEEEAEEEEEGEEGGPREDGEAVSAAAAGGAAQGGSEGMGAGGAGGGPKAGAGGDTAAKEGDDGEEVTPEQAARRRALADAMRRRQAEAEAKKARQAEAARKAAEAEALAAKRQEEADLLSALDGVCATAPRTPRSQGTPARSPRSTRSSGTSSPCASPRSPAHSSPHSSSDSVPVLAGRDSPTGFASPRGPHRLRTPSSGPLPQQRGSPARTAAAQGGSAQGQARQPMQMSPNRSVMRGSGDFSVGGAGVGADPRRIRPSGSPQRHSMGVINRGTRITSLAHARRPGPPPASGSNSTTTTASTAGAAAIPITGTTNSSSSTTTTTTTSTTTTTTPTRKAGARLTARQRVQLRLQEEQAKRQLMAKREALQRLEGAFKQHLVTMDEYKVRKAALEADMAAMTTSS